MRCDRCLKWVAHLAFPAANRLSLCGVQFSFSSFSSAESFAGRDGEDFVGVFRPLPPSDRHVVVQAYASIIESDDGAENFRITALVDVGGRERAQIEQFESQIRDRDMLMRELQHRVKNNLQLITALIRLEARSAAEGETVTAESVRGSAVSVPA